MVLGLCCGIRAMLLGYSAHHFFNITAVLASQSDQTMCLVFSVTPHKSQASQVHRVEQN